MTDTTKANMQNSEERDEFEANENNFRKNVQQPAKNAISHNMSSAKQKCYEDTICFKGPAQLELTVLVFHPVSHTNTRAQNHVQPSSTTTTTISTKEIARRLPQSLKHRAHSQLCYWVSSHNGLRRAIEIRWCTYTKVGWDNCKMTEALAYPPPSSTFGCDS